MADYYTNTSDYAPSKPIVSSEMNRQPSRQDNMFSANDQQMMQQPMMRQPMMQPMMQQPMGDMKQYLYDMNPFDFDWKDVMKRAVKYLIEGVAVAFVAYAFTRGKLDFKEILMLGITAAFVFAILDTFSPTVSLGVRFGAGFGIGQSLFGVGAAGLPLATSVIAF